MNILAIDPGNIETAYCVIDVETLRPIEFGKISNEKLINYIPNLKVNDMAIEMIASYGMPVGKEVFETCVWIGKFLERMDNIAKNIDYVYRMEEKMHICNNPRARDATIKKALIDRFGEKGTKKNPGWFYGFSADVWQAYAVGITYIETKMYKRKE